MVPAAIYAAAAAEFMLLLLHAHLLSHTGWWVQLAWVFHHPVDTQQYPDYTRYVSQPMDFGTMQQKVTDGVYREPAEVR